MGSPEIRRLEAIEQILDGYYNGEDYGKTKERTEAIAALEEQKLALEKCLGMRIIRPKDVGGRYREEREKGKGASK